MPRQVSVSLMHGQQYASVREDYGCVICCHEPGRGPCYTVHERGRKRPQERRWEIFRCMRRNIAKNVQQPRRQKPRRIFRRQQKQTEHHSPDNQTVRNIVGVKQIRRKYRQRGRTRNFPRQSECDPAWIHNVKDTERKQIRSHADHGPGEKSSTPLGREK